MTLDSKPSSNIPFTKRAEKVLYSIGFSPLGFTLLVLLLVMPNVPPFNQQHMIRWLVMGALYAAQAMAFDFTVGYINIANFGFAAIGGVGAYTSAILANTSPVLALQPGISPWIGIWFGALASGLIGFVVGVITLRLRGIFAANTAWFVGLAMIGLARNLTGLTRGPAGMAPETLLTTSNNLPYFYIIMIMMLTVYITLQLVVKSRFGLAFRAIGQNYDAARASGINPTLYRVVNFTLSCFFAGWLGGFYAHYFGSLTPTTLMHTSKTVEILAICYIGGRGTLWGGMAVAFPFVFFIEYLRSNFTQLPGVHLVVYGILMMLVMIYYPGGVAGLFYSAKSWVLQRWVQRKATAPAD